MDKFKREKKNLEAGSSKSLKPKCLQTTAVGLLLCSCWIEPFSCTSARQKRCPHWHSHLWQKEGIWHLQKWKTSSLKNIFYKYFYINFRPELRKKLKLKTITPTNQQQKKPHKPTCPHKFILIIWSGLQKMNEQHHEKSDLCVPYYTWRPRSSFSLNHFMSQSPFCKQTIQGCWIIQ